MFTKRLNRAVELSGGEVRSRWEEHGADKSGFAGHDAQQSFQLQNAHLDLGGAEFLQYIQETKNPEFAPSALSFAADSLFCEWCYVLDLDANKIEIYKGFNQEPLSEDERFFFLQKHGVKYYPVKFLVSFDIDKKLKKKWKKWFKAYQKKKD